MLPDHMNLWADIAHGLGNKKTMIAHMPVLLSWITVHGPSHMLPYCFLSRDIPSMETHGPSNICSCLQHVQRVSKCLRTSCSAELVATTDACVGRGNLPTTPRHTERQRPTLQDTNSVKRSNLPTNHPAETAVDASFLLTTLHCNAALPTHAALPLGFLLPLPLPLPWPLRPLPLAVHSARRTSPLYHQIWGSWTKSGVHRTKPMYCQSFRVLDHHWLIGLGTVSGYSILHLCNGPGLPQTLTRLLITSG